MRLGGSYGKLKRHEFFTDFDWDHLLYFSLKAPWTPPADKIINGTKME
jgi:cGMP-dependent protein kinase